MRSPRRLLERDSWVRAAYAAHGAELYRFGVRALGDRAAAEEAVQDTFVRAWRAADRFDPEIGSLRTWLFAIMRNVVIDHSRARAARPPLADTEGRPPVAPDDFDRTLLAWQTEEAMRRLSEHHRRVLIETYFHARPYAEVAAELGIPAGTVKSRVYYALRALRLALEEMGWNDDG